MTGIVYQLTDNRIIAIVPDVLEASDTGVKGKNHELRGIDGTKAGIKIITPFAVTEGGKIILEDGGQEYGEGDTIDAAVLVDTRAQLPKTKDQEIDDLGAQLFDAQTQLLQAQQDNSNLGSQLFDLQTQLYMKGVL